MKNILFCSDPMNSKKVDTEYENEFNACRNYNVNIGLIHYEEIVMGNIQKSVKNIPHLDKVAETVYRGWMLSEENYRLLYNELLKKNIKLINDPDKYLFCHYLPLNYEIIKEFTPETVWADLADGTKYDILEVMKKIEIFKGKPVILKDYVKSQKHYWKEACYIENSRDINIVKSVVDRFIELQGENLTGGLVFREFIEFEFLNFHPKSNMPLTKEFRLFFFKNRLAAEARYWDEGIYNDDIIENISTFENIAEQVKSNFFSMDIAKSKTGKWWIVELGDGQVTGFPGSITADSIYENMTRNSFSSSSGKDSE